MFIKQTYAKVVQIFSKIQVSKYQDLSLKIQYKILFLNTWSLILLYMQSVNFLQTEV